MSLNPRFFSVILFTSAALLGPTAQAGSLTDLAKAATSSSASAISLPADLTGSLKNLASSFNLSQLNYAGLAKDALSALGAGKDSQALATLDKLGAAKLTDGQLSLFKTAYAAVGAYALQHNFSGVPAVQSLVNDSVAQLKSGDIAGVTAKLQNLATSLKPTTEQKAVLDSLVNYYKSATVKK